MYNLVQPVTGTFPSSSRFLHERSKLRELLCRWNETYTTKQSQSPNKLIYVLEKTYKRELLRAPVLLGLDKVRVNHLTGVCVAEGFCLYLASLEHNKSGETTSNHPDYPNPYDHYGKWDNSDDGIHELDDIQTEEFILERIVDLEGVEIAPTLEISARDLVNFSVEDREAESEDRGYDGYATHYWRNTVSQSSVVYKRNIPLTMVTKHALR